MNKPNIHKWGALMGAGVVFLGLAGCADRNKNGQPDSPATGAEVDKAVEGAGDKMGAAVDTAGDKMSNAVADAGTAAKGAAGAVGDALEPAVVTPKIKAAIATGMNGALKGSKIDVDTNGGTNTVTLKGTVKSEAQKKMAGAMATKEAKGYKIANNLVVKK